jgi:hypothetical protein
MIKNIRVWLFGILFFITVNCFAQEIWTIGPMFHFNFGGGQKPTTSFAVEVAYWNVDKVPYSLDFGMEFDRGKFRLYSEGQTGIGLTGIALGPVLEFNSKESKVRVGVQGSCWANYFLGVDYRIRFIDKKKFHCIGLYGKLPFATSGLDSDGDGDDWDSDWDWD